MYVSDNWPPAGEKTALSGRKAVVNSLGCVSTSYSTTINKKLRAHITVLNRGDDVDAGILKACLIEIVEEIPSEMPKAKDSVFLKRIAMIFGRKMVGNVTFFIH